MTNGLTEVIANEGVYVALAQAHGLQFQRQMAPESISSNEPVPYTVFEGRLDGGPVKVEVNILAEYPGMEEDGTRYDMTVGVTITEFTDHRKVKNNRRIKGFDETVAGLEGVTGVYSSFKPTECHLLYAIEREDVAEVPRLDAVLSAVAEYLT